jgi:hypothetical protein
LVGRGEVRFQADRLLEIEHRPIAVAGRKADPPPPVEGQRSLGIEPDGLFTVWQGARIVVGGNIGQASAVERRSVIRLESYRLVQVPDGQVVVSLGQVGHAPKPERTREIGSRQPPRLDRRSAGTNRQLGIARHVLVALPDLVGR